MREGTIDKSSRLRRFLAWQLQNSDSKLLATQARINLLLNTHCLVLLRSVQGFKAETNPQLLLSLVPLIRFYGKLAALILLYLRELCRGLTSLPEPYSVEQLNDLQSKLGMPALSLILHPISLYHMLHLYIRLLRLPDELQKLKALRPATHAPMLRARDQAADVLLGTLQQMPVPVNTFRIFLMGCIRALTPAPGPAPATGAPQAADPDLKLAEERLMVEARLSELHLPGALKILQDVVPGLFLTADQPPAGAAGAGAGAAGSFKVSMAALRYTDLSELEFVERAAAVGSAAPPPAKRVSAVTRGVIGGGAQVFRGLRLAVWRCVRCGAEQEDVPLAQRAAWQVHGLQNCVCGGAWEDVRKGRLVDRDYVR